MENTKNNNSTKALVDTLIMAVGGFNESQLKDMAENRLANPPIAESTIVTQQKESISQEDFIKLRLKETAEKIGKDIDKLNDANDISSNKKSEKLNSNEKLKEPIQKSKSDSIEQRKELKEPVPKAKSESSEQKKELKVPIPKAKTESIEQKKELKEPIPKKEIVKSTTEEKIEENRQNITNKPSYSKGYSY